MIKCTRKFHFDAAHRIIEHKGKCRDLHGHRYVMEVSFASEKTDSMGMVIDFGTVKEILGTWIDENFDHNTILSIKDSQLGEYIHSITGQKIYYMEDNPTAENIALHLLNDICPKLFVECGVGIQKILIHETPNCSAAACLPHDETAPQ